MTFSIPAPRHLSGLETCTWMYTEMVSFGPFSFNTHGTLTLQHQVIIITRCGAVLTVITPRPSCGGCNMATFRLDGLCK